MSEALIQSPQGVFAVLTSVCMVCFYLSTKFTKFFNYLPSIIWIYFIPLLLTNLGILPAKSPVYTMLRTYAIPLFIVIMLLEINIKSIFSLAGKAIGVMLFASLGVVVGCVIAFSIFKSWLPADAWKGVAALTGSWTGGTGNMVAVGNGFNISDETMGLAILTDSLVAVIWIPFLIWIKRFNKVFCKFSCGHDFQTENAQKFADEYTHKSKQMTYRDFVSLLAIGFLVLWFSKALASILPELEPVLSTSTWALLIISLIAVSLSTTALHKIPGTHAVATGIIYIFVASMGARAQLSGISKAPVFILMGFTVNIIHIVIAVFGAKLFKVDISVLAIASAANHGGAASAPVVAGTYDSKLVPLAIIMALVGYAIGNFLGILTGNICYFIY